MATVNTNDLLDAGQVAELLGLAHRNSVTTYLNRYPDFPQPVLVRASGRVRLWHRDDILAWKAPAAEERTGGADARNRRALIDAGRELMSKRPAGEISIRDIARRAGIPHTMLYRHIGSKEELRRIIVDEVVTDVRAQIPPTADPTEAALGAVRAAINHADDFRILAFSLLSGDETGQYDGETVLTALLRVMRAQDGQGPIDTDVAVAAIGALILGWGTFRDRIQQGTGIDDIPRDQVDLITRAIIGLATGATHVDA